MERSGNSVNFLFIAFLFTFFFVGLWLFLFPDRASAAGLTVNYEYYFTDCYGAEQRWLDTDGIVELSDFTFKPPLAMPVGYMFDRWYEDEACTVEATLASLPQSGTVRLYSRLEVITYNVVFGDKAFVVSYFDDISDMAEIPLKQGYAFAGWRDEQGVTVVDKNNKQNALILNDVRLTAAYEEITLKESVFEYDGKNQYGSVSLKNSESQEVTLLFGGKQTNDMKNAGEYLLQVRRLNSSGTSIGEARFTISITLKIITVSSIPIYYYLGDRVETHFEYSGFAEGEGVLDLQAAATLAIPQNQGIYTLTGSGAKAQNYVFRYEPFRVTVMQKTEDIKDINPPDPSTENPEGVTNLPPTRNQLGTREKIVIAVVTAVTLAILGASGLLLSVKMKKKKI